MKSKSKSKDNRKALIVTGKQIEVIRDACELYGRIQIGQFERFAEIVTQTGFSGWSLRVQPERKKDETDESYKRRCREAENYDMLVCRCIKGALDGIYREAYHLEGKRRTNEANVSLDIWAKLDGRREDSNFSMSTEPLVQVKDLDGN